MIYVMRHGESVVNLQRRLTCRQYDGDLSPAGREQAQKAARWFAGRQLTHIRHSPFHRAQQTAEIVGAALGITPTVEDDLREMDCGSLEGRTDEEAWGIWAGVYQRWQKFESDSRFPDGESYGEASARFKRALSRIPAGENVLLVTHGGISVTVLPPLCVNVATMGWVEHLLNTGIIVLERYDAERYSCSAWNLIEHLSD